MNKSISDGIVPDLWKVARVTPLYKSDDKLQVENYRPISVLPVLSKVVERVVHSQLNAHLHQLDFLYQHQYGFRHGHSTEQAITQLNNWVLPSMDKGKVTGLLFVDISKAFDSLNHKVLLHKLKHLGLSERSLRWFRSYLAHRQQSVLINGELSEPHTITLGVPQGSILGPLLFNVYINSLPNAVKETRMILYADDAVLFCDASTRQELQIALEREFTEISNWYTDNRLTINVKKTKFMLAGSKRILSLFEDFELQPNGTQIDRMQSFKYLGVTTNAKGS